MKLKNLHEYQIDFEVPRLGISGLFGVKKRIQSIISIINTLYFYQVIN